MVKGKEAEKRGGQATLGHNKDSSAEELQPNKQTNTCNPSPSPLSATTNNSFDGCMRHTPCADHVEVGQGSERGPRNAAGLDRLDPQVVRRLQRKKKSSGAVCACVSCVCVCEYECECVCA